MVNAHSCSRCGNVLDYQYASFWKCRICGWWFDIGAPKA